MNPLETHAKNMAWIDARISEREELLPSRLLGMDIYANSLTANRKVLERHGPRLIAVEYDGGHEKKHWGCENHCNYSLDKDFCPTYTDITEGLGDSK